MTPAEVLSKEVYGWVLGIYNIFGTFHRPLNIDIMWQYKKTVSNNECKLSV